MAWCCCSCSWTTGLREWNISTSALRTLSFCSFFFVGMCASRRVNRMRTLYGDTRTQKFSAFFSLLFIIIKCSRSYRVTIASIFNFFRFFLFFVTTFLPFRSVYVPAQRRFSFFSSPVGCTECDIVLKSGGISYLFFS